MKAKLFICIAACLAVVACNKTQSTLSTDMDEIVMDYEGGNINIKVICPVETLTTVTYEEGDGWVFVLPRHLWGNGTLSITLERYSNTEFDRHAVAAIVGDGVYKEIRITQAHKPRPGATDLDLDRMNIYADVEGGTWNIGVSTAKTWTVTSPASWCQITGGSGTGSGQFTVKVEPSTDYQYRTAEVKVTADAIERILLVQHVGTKIGDVVWANANVDDPDTFGANCEVRGKLYQYNSKVPYPSYAANDHVASEDPVPGFVTGEYDTMSNTWTEENDPCPDGWKVPTINQLQALIGSGQPTPFFWFDFYLAKGRSVAGAYVGLDRIILQDEVTKDDMMGAIFIPQTGTISRDDGKMHDWWDAAVWSCTNVGQTWDMRYVWMNGNQQYGDTDWAGSRTAMGVRCVKK